MKITKDKFVRIHYTLKDDEGKVLDSSIGKEALSYVQGNDMLIPGLEAQLEGKEASDKFTAIVEAKDAYGEYNDKLVLEVPKIQFEGTDDIQVGMFFQASAADGSSILVHVKSISDDTVTIDGNHELAGKRLTFDVEVVEVRDSTPEDFNTGCGCGGGCGNCGGDCSDDCSCGCGGNCGN